MKKRINRLNLKPWLPIFVLTFALLIAVLPAHPAEAAVTGSITINSPRGDEIWEVGSKQSITWTSNGVKGNVTILLSRDAGTIFSTIAYNVSNGDGAHTYTWKVTSPVTALGRIKIVSISTPSILAISPANFIISSCPSKPVLESPSGTVNTLTPVLNWADTAGASCYRVQLSKSSSFSGLLVDQSGLTGSSYTLSSGVLAWNTSYYWRANAGNSLGTSGWSNAFQFKTAASATPTAPSNLTATTISSTQIGLAWQDNSADESGFKVERKTGSGSYAQIASVKGVSSYSDKGLLAGTAYTYRVRAYKGTINSDYSNEATMTTSSASTIALKLVYPSDKAWICTLYPMLIWDGPSTVASYRLQVSNKANMSAPFIDALYLTCNNYTITSGLYYGGEYYWRVNFTNYFGSTSNWSPIYSFKPAMISYETIFFSQKNAGWANKLMGRSGLRVYDYGCAMTCAAMLLKYSGKETDPNLLNAYLSDNDTVGYSGNTANINWEGPAAYSDGRICLVSSGTSTDNWVILNRELDDGHPVIVQVDINPKTPAIEEHWVLVTHRSGSVYYINDPNDLSYSSSKVLSYYYNTASQHTFYQYVIYHPDT